MKPDLKGTFSVQGLLAPLNGANFTAPSQLQIETPWAATVGLRFKATPQLTLNAQATRYGWEQYDAVRIVAAGQTSVVPQNYSNTTSVAVGADYALTSTWTFRTGVRFDQTPTPANLREAGVPDTDTRLFAVGASFQPTPGVTLDAAIGYTDYSDGAVFHDAPSYVGSPAETLARMRGSINRSATTISTGLRWRF
jgi:long-chain fatty acid transport protein